MINFAAEAEWRVLQTFISFYDKIATIGADPSSNVANLTLGKHWINTVFYRWLSLITTEKYKPQSHNFVKNQSFPCAPKNFNETQSILTKSLWLYISCNAMQRNVKEDKRNLIDEYCWPGYQEGNTSFTFRPNLKMLRQFSHHLVLRVILDSDWSVLVM